MSNETIDKLVWVLIYAGLFVAGVGIWFMEQQRGIAWSLLVGGALLVGGGAVLIWLRSRRP